MDNCPSDETILVPEQGRIQTQIEAILAPIGQCSSNQWLVELMDVEARVIEPAADVPLFALSILTSAGQVGEPASQIDFSGLEQGDRHPQASGQMGLVDPRTGLPQPSLQSIVEGGVLFTGIDAYEWYLSFVP